MMKATLSASPTVDSVMPTARICALRDGDTAVLESVLHSVLPFVRGLLFRMLGPGPHLDDAVQDALIDLAAALRRYEGRASLKTYAGRVTARVAYRYYKKRARDATHESFSEDSFIASGDPEFFAMDRERVRTLFACMDTLPAKHRMAFVLCDIEGLQPGEAARLLRVHPITLRSHLRRARRGLSARIDAQPQLRGCMESES